MPDVVVTLRDRVVTRVPVRTHKLTVGRDAACDVTIDSPGISRLHAIILCEHTRYRVVDQESQNGITVDGRRVREVALGIGHDEGVEIGKFRLQVVNTPQGTAPQDVHAAAAHAARAGPRNIVSTVAIDDDAARNIQARLAARMAPPAEPIHRSLKPRHSMLRSVLWWLAVAVAAFAAVTLLRQLFE